MPTVDDVLPTSHQPPGNAHGLAGPGNWVDHRTTLLTQPSQLNRWPNNITHIGHDGLRYYTIAPDRLLIDRLYRYLLTRMRSLDRSNRGVPSPLRSTGGFLPDITSPSQPLRLRFTTMVIRFTATITQPTTIVMLTHLSSCISSFARLSSPSLDALPTHPNSQRCSCKALVHFCFSTRSSSESFSSP